MRYSNILTRIASKQKMVDDFVYDKLEAGVKLADLLPPYEIKYVEDNVLSIRNASKKAFKIKLIKDVMKRYGFEYVAGGTNRECYSHPMYPNIIVKVAIDRVGAEDNPREYIVQEYLKPYCAKAFEYSERGVFGVFERVVPITNEIQFNSLKDIIIPIIELRCINHFVMEDIGFESFKNWALRDGYYPVLCDYPYMYSVADEDLYCMHEDKNNPGAICGGNIWYDDRYNHLYCEKCGDKYQSAQLGKKLMPKMKITDMTYNVVDKHGIVTNTGKDGRDMAVIVARKGNKIINKVDTDRETKRYESKRERAFRKKQSRVSEPRVRTNWEIAEEKERQMREAIGKSGYTAEPVVEEVVEPVIEEEVIVSKKVVVVPTKEEKVEEVVSETKSEEVKVNTNESKDIFSEAFCSIPEEPKMVEPEEVVEEEEVETVYAEEYDTSNVMSEALMSALSNDLENDKEEAVTESIIDNKEILKTVVDAVGTSTIKLSYDMEEEDIEEVEEPTAFGIDCPNCRYGIVDTASDGCICSRRGATYLQNYGEIESCDITDEERYSRPVIEEEEITSVPIESSFIPPMEDDEVRPNRRTKKRSITYNDNY